MTMTTRDRTLVRDLARRYAEIALDPKQEERRNLWRAHNSLKPVSRIPVYIRAYAWSEMPQARLQCEDQRCRRYENLFRQALFADTFDDDTILENWVAVGARHKVHPDGLWGVPVKWRGRTRTTAGVCDAPLKQPGDIEKLTAPSHAIDEEATAAELAAVQDLIGDIVPVVLTRAPLYIVWNGDISTRLAELRGLEQIMWDMGDRPQWLHRLLTFMRDGILSTHEAAERAGDWTLPDHYNQAMPYAEELADPAPDGVPVTRDKLWCFCASQETTLVGPDMFEEFMLRYQIPIMQRFGLVAYGCCEDLTNKIDLLRRIPNLRRIAVSPMANVARCAERIGTDYVLSYRPSPSDMVGYGFDPERIRRVIREDLEACRDCVVDITLKDVETVQGDPERVRRFVSIARDVAEAVG